MMPASSPKSPHVGAVSSRDRCSDPQIADPDVATHGWCSHCRQQGEVRRYRMALIGLRWMDDACAERMNAMGLYSVLVPDAEPRKADRGFRARRRMGLEPRRRRLYWLHHLWSAA